ncbi:MAG: Hsp20/alpha crystallin family protein [Acidimicrobiales bacterium]
MLLRFDPAHEIDRFGQALLRDARANFAPVDAYREGDRYVVEIDLPGVEPGSIDITAERNVLTVAAERHVARKSANRAIIAERFDGTFRRTVYLGRELDSTNVEASYDNGVLRLEIPIAESSKPRKINVTTTTPSEVPSSN